MFVNVDEFIKKNILDNMKLVVISYFDNCVWVFVKVGYVIGIVYFIFGIFFFF